MMTELVDWKGSKVLEEVFSQDENLSSLRGKSNQLTLFLQELERNSDCDSEASNRVFHMLLQDLEQLAKKDQKWLICLLSIHLVYGEKKDAIGQLVHILCHSNLNFDIKWFVYWALVRHFFLNNLDYDESFRFKTLSESYKAIFNDFYIGLGKAVNKVDSIVSVLMEPEYLSKKSLKNKIVLVTNQFLTESHAPTSLCLNMAREYIELGFHVSIINLAMLPSDFPVIFVGGNTFNNILQYNLPQNKIYIDGGDVNLRATSDSQTTICYCGIDIPFCQLENVEQMAVVVSNLLIEKPKLVVSISDNNLLADALAKIGGNEFPVVTHPTSSGLPIQLDTIPMYLNHPVAGMSELEKDNSLTLTRSYSTRHFSSGLTRAELKLPSDKFLISVVGNRLKSELSEEWIDSAKKILNDFDDIVFVFIGSLEHEICHFFEKEIDQVVFLNYQPDLYSVINLTNLYYNPDRSGGGISALMALGAGIPVATLSRIYSDVAWWVQERFSFNTYDDIFSYIVNCKVDLNFYEKECKEARIEYNSILNAPSSFKTILVDCGLI
ncbi:hypothetical protein [Agarivorans sp. Z349TD_8]|uniref:hypothetical protein n=1 Tax=Agarivorans sp. Z349TD_8 TaxID=3421434 RepID=UPI003D7C43A8